VVEDLPVDCLGAKTCYVKVYHYCRQQVSDNFTWTVVELSGKNPTSQKAMMTTVY